MPVSLWVRERRLTLSLDEDMKRVLPPVYFLTAILLMAALHVLAPVRGLIGFPWRLLGILPLLLGAALNIAADHSLKQHRTTVSFKKPAR